MTQVEISRSVHGQRYAIECRGRRWQQQGAAIGIRDRGSRAQAGERRQIDFAAGSFDVDLDVIGDDAAQKRQQHLASASGHDRSAAESGAECRQRRQADRAARARGTERLAKERRRAQLKAPGILPRRSVNQVLSTV